MPDVIAGPLGPPVAVAARGETDAVPVPVGLDRGAPDATTMDGRPFADAFRDAYGYEVTPAAVAGYRLARRIDTAVRAIGGEVGDRDALAAALAGSD
jgi:ABC-type branched-subunit amino acid transport system substrate-binding protein